MKEILIRLEDELYEQCKTTELTEENEGFDFHIIKSVANGTVLPKEHGRLIDADAYKEKVFRKFPCNDRDDMNIRRLTEMAVLNAPTVIEADKGE